MREWASPGGGRNARPCGIAATPDEEIRYSESGVWPNTRVGFDPASESFQTWSTPSGGGVVRRMVSTPEGVLCLACSGVGKVAVVCPVRTPRRRP